MDIPEAHYFAVTNFLCCAATRFGILPSNTAYAHLIKYGMSLFQIFRRAAHNRKTSAPDEY